MVSGGLALSAGTKVDPDTPIYAHYPVRLRVGGTLSEDMGQRIRRPMAFQGLTKKEARTGNIPGVDENWIRWNQESETYFSHQEDKRGQEYKGRGQKTTYVNNTISPPQDNSEGFAIAEEMRDPTQTHQNENISNVGQQREREQWRRSADPLQT
eukprot:1617691-Heterocapsa_arctica.AAC.1